MYLILTDQDNILATGGGYVSRNTPFYRPRRLGRKMAFKLRTLLQDKTPDMVLRVVDEDIVYKMRK